MKTEGGHASPLGEPEREFKSLIDIVNVEADMQRHHGGFVYLADSNRFFPPLDIQVIAQRQFSLERFDEYVHFIMAGRQSFVWSPEKMPPRVNFRPWWKKQTAS